MSRARGVVTLFDVDNTLLDNDRVAADLAGHLEARFGADLVSIVLFGSWALDEGRMEGDIDLLVVIRGLVGGRLERYQLARQVSEELAKRLSLIVSTPDASIYSVLDVREVARPGFDAQEFVMYCARRGAVELEGRRYTLLVAPMAGFYRDAQGPNPGRTQMRIAYVEPPEAMQKVPILFRELLGRFEAQRS